tara:strand:+ start:100 stop:798 length:699 start_codon:yes stop_codon:yes gene_type:complete
MFKNYLELSKYRKIIYFINKIYHFFFGEKFSKTINFNFGEKNRIELIEYVIKKNNYNSYLEIGCYDNRVFDKIKTKTKIGVDPISGGTFRGTSDNFFKQNNLTFDCIFIDGLHEYKQVRRDILNSIKFLSKNGIIILHDCLPETISRQRVPRTRYSWNGDVWKAVVEARTWKDFDTYTVVADQGLGIIIKRNNSNILDIDNHKFSNLKYKFFYENYNKIMRTITYEEFLKIF